MKREVTYTENRVLSALARVIDAKAALKNAESEDVAATKELREAIATAKWPLLVGD